MDEQPYAPQQPDRPVSELDRLYSELTRVHELINTLEGRLHPVIHHGLRNAEKALAAGASQTQESHISVAVTAANAAGNRIREIIDSLAV